MLLSVKKTNSAFMPEDHHVQRICGIRQPNFPQSYSVDNLSRDQMIFSRKVKGYNDREIDNLEGLLLEPIEVGTEDCAYGQESSVDDVDEDYSSQWYPESFKIKDRITLKKNLARNNLNKSFGCFHSDDDSGAYSGASTPENLNIPQIEHLSSPPLVLTAHRQVHGY